MTRSSSRGAPTAGPKQFTGKAARSSNIKACRAIGEAVRSTLGPNGRDKMLVTDVGDVVVTNKGATILSEMAVDSPPAQLVVDVAEGQREAVGDGTTTATVLAAELLAQAESLIEQGLRVPPIVEGYQLAAERARRRLDEIAFDLAADRHSRVARTAMAGKGPAGGRDVLAEYAVQAAEFVASEPGMDLDDLVVETLQSGPPSASELVEGLIVDKDVAVASEMPDRVEDAKIALIDTDIEATEVRRSQVGVSLEEPEDLDPFLEREANEIDERVGRILDSRASVVFCLDGIDDRAQHLLSEAGVLAFRRVKHRDMHNLARATGAREVSIDGLEPNDLGSAGLVEARTVGDRTCYYVEDCADPNALTVVLRSGTQRGLEELEWTFEDALRAVTKVRETDGRVVPGGGAVEMAVADAIRDGVAGVSGREQFAVDAFVDAMEVIPRTLAEEAGADPIDALVALRSRHADGGSVAGWGVDGLVEDVVDAGIVDPLAVKRNAFSTAVEVATLVLRIDGIIFSEADDGGAKSDAAA